MTGTLLATFSRSDVTVSQEESPLVPRLARQPQAEGGEDVKPKHALKWRGNANLNAASRGTGAVQRLFAVCVNLPGCRRRLANHVKHTFESGKS